MKTIQDIINQRTHLEKHNAILHNEVVAMRTVQKQQAAAAEKTLLEIQRKCAIISKNNEQYFALGKTLKEKARAAPA